MGCMGRAVMPSLSKDTSVEENRQNFEESSTIMPQSTVNRPWISRAEARAKTRAKNVLA